MDWIDWAAVVAVASIVAGVYVLAGPGWALVSFGVLLAGVVVATLVVEVRRGSAP